MTETEIQKLFAYQYGLLNNNLVLPNITMGSLGARYESDAGIMTVRNFRGRCVKIRRKATIRRSVEPIKETKLLELMYIGCMKWYTVDDRMCLY